MNADDFEKWVTTWIACQSKASRGERSEDEFWAVRRFHEFRKDRAEICWEAILAILSRNPDQDVISNLAAGPLEDLIRFHGPDFIDRIEHEAKFNLKFRYLLGGVWKVSTPEVWERVEKVRGVAW